jgi:hypothetical protein
VASHEATESARTITPRAPGELRRTVPWIRAQIELDETATPTFTWPVPEHSPVMASTALRLDLLD